jgi:cell division septation protein DedD
VSSNTHTRVRPRRPQAYRPARRSARGGTLLGIFIGLVMGLALAASVAYYLGRSGLTVPLASTGQSKEGARGAKADAAAGAAIAADKPRFDFYKILPGGEEPKSPPERKAERPAEKSVPVAVAKAPDKEPAKAADRFWLQAGAFNGEPDAENLRARLAMAGWEAVVQTVPLPDRSVRYRVRLGPYDNTDELNRIKGELGKGGFDVAVIRNP